VTALDEYGERRYGVGFNFVGVAAASERSRW
jgi:hypothetical protein